MLLNNHKARYGLSLQIYKNLIEKINRINIFLMNKHYEFFLIIDIVKYKFLISLLLLF